jgi:hypothetical protein
MLDANFLSPLLNEFKPLNYEIVVHVVDHVVYSQPEMF